MQRVIVVAREIIILDGPALQSFELLYRFSTTLIFSGISFIFVATPAFISPYFHLNAKKNRKTDELFDYIMQIIYFIHLFHHSCISSDLDLDLDLDGFGLMSFVLNFGSSRLISFS